MSKKILNCILFLVVSVIISSPAFAISNDDVVGYWDLDSDKVNGILIIKPNSIAFDKQQPTPVNIVNSNDKLVFTAVEGADLSFAVNIIDQNTIKLETLFANEVVDLETYTRIDETTAKKYIKERPKFK